MESQEGNSAPILKEFQIEGTWAPVTPIKQPTLTDQRSIIEHREREIGLPSQTYLRELEAQTLLSCSISSAERSLPNGNNYNINNVDNNIWDTHNNSSSIGRRILETEHVGMQRRGLEDCLPHWCTQGRRSMGPQFVSSAQSSYPNFSFSSWELPNNGVRENANVIDSSYDESLAQFNNMSFGDLLTMKSSALQPSMASLSSHWGNNSSGSITDMLFPRWDSQMDVRVLNSSSTSLSQDALHGANQQMNNICRGEMLSGAFSHQDRSLCSVLSPPSMKHSKRNNSTFAPPTPDLLWRAECTVTSGNTNPGMEQTPNKQNSLQEHEPAAAMVYLRDVSNQEIMESLTDTSPGKVSAIVEENHNPDKEGELGIDLNKTPQKKQRRKRYLPKVLRENKPKRTPKPRIPKTTDSKEAPRVKRKYVRKNKMNPSSTTTPVEATEIIDPKPTQGVLKSCKRSLNFDLNGQVTENSSLHTLEPQPKENAAASPSIHTAHIGQGEVVVETSEVEIAYDLNHSLHQELKNYMSKPTTVTLENLHHDQTVPTGDKEKNASSLSGNHAEVLSRTDTYQVQKHNYSLSASSDGGIHKRGSKRGHSSITNATEVDAGNVAANQCTFWEPSPTSLDHANVHGVPGILFPEICKKKRTEKGQRSHASSTCSAAAFEDVSLATTAINHPTVDPSTSKHYYCNPASFVSNAITINRAEILMRNVQNRAQLLNTWADIARLKKKKRSKGATRVRNLSALEGIASLSPATPAAKCPRRSKVQTSSDPYLCTSSCMNLSNNVHSFLEALADDTHTAPRSKRGLRKQPSSRSSNKANNRWDLVLYDGNHSVRKKPGRKSTRKMYPENKMPSPVSFPAGSKRWIRTFSLEAITEGLKQLDINRECNEISCQETNALVPYNVNNEEQNALVLYKSDGAIVPFEGPFEPLRKRRQRAKVELDDETTRVWRLLLENIDNQGINGTDEEKVKWWENERGVFRGRVDSFIARMRLVQGDRRFTPWKGSVLDSVIGVFLTQNVSDHLSSSAFMSLAARFPLNSECTESTLSEVETAALVVEPEVFVVEPEESITWNEKPLDPPICDRNSRIIHEIDCGEEKEVVDSKEQVGSATDSVIRADYSSESSQKATNESRVNKASSPTTDTDGASITGDDRARDDATSSQQSVISSQNSVTSTNFQTVGIMSAFSDSNSGGQAPTPNSQCYYFDPSTSFIGLLKMAESPLLHESYSQIPRQDQVDSRKHFTNDFPEAPSTSSSDYQSHLQIDFHLQATKYVEMLETDSRSSDTSRKGDNSPIEQSNLTTESTVEDLGKEKAWDAIPRSLPENISLCYVLEGGKMVTQLQEQSVKGPLDSVASSAQGQTSSISANLPNASQASVIESTTGSDRRSNYHKEVKQTPKHSHATAGAFEIVSPSPSKPKSRPGKEKRNAYDWDSLRRDAQANGRTRERTAKTRDSLDWEALRRADVSEIADTIKARGMNNMLSERIKDLLERLVRDHGSIDLEWLRDIPPDKAKEYLLSFRGLGLKSVECVRLLTLHHLAFPVDTNVGRIAVRLGWVPLQPLPESLQLHLLEMYPVLESIQKYLWPRLCKLDQKTLYELHYHLITFGKVFCTKRQPNCNACPLRGECRHFASAFASARLALPGPEERSIMSSSAGTSSHLHPQANVNPLPLPPPFWGNQHSESNLHCNQGASVVTVPSTSLSLPVPQAVNYLEKNLEIRNCEPIVEVPASPEPPLEQEPTLCDIEDNFYEDPDEIPLITLNMKEFTQTLENYMQANRELQETGVSRALVALTPEAASIPRPKLKNISRLRTEHYVYELPDAHPLLQGLAKREPDDPCSYLLAIWTPGETANSIQPPERRCSFEDPNILCNEVTCAYCSSQREANTEIVRGTLLIPCRTAMRGSFPLNGTYFQVNEVFADHDSSLNPIEVPRSWLWNLPRRTVYFGTSIPTIFRGLTTEDIQHCFWRGFVCVRGFDHKTRSPRPLMARLHFPASRMPRGAKGKAYADE